MKPSRFALSILLPMLVLASGAARADDIDLYAGSVANGAASNLLIILDNASAWNANQSYTCNGFTVPTNNVGKNVGFEQCGLYNAVNAIGNSSSLLGNIKLGLMYFPLTGASAKNGGSFVLPSPSPAPASLVLMDSTGIASMKSTITALDAQASNSNNNQIPQAMQEAWAFYQGKTGLSGTQYPGVSADSTCGRNFVVYITLATNNTKPQDPGNVGQNALTTAAGAAQPVLTLPAWPGASGKYQSDYGDEWAKFMYSGTTANTSLTYPSITTYTIILTDGSNPDYEQYMIGMATAGGGKYFLVKLGDTDGLAQALLKIFNEVQAVNSVFASPGLPVTSNAQGTYKNQIFLASFRPDAQGKPRWLGNLKQYQFGVNSSGLYTTPATGVSLFLGDASWGPYGQYLTANSALTSAGSGFISPNAISYWTTRDTTTLPDSLGGFWVNKTGIGTGYDLPDGQFVEKGGVGQQVRLTNLQDDYVANPSSPRKLYTCTGSSGACATGASLSATPFATTNANITASSLSALGTPLSLVSITRSGTTATGTLSTAPSPVLTAGQSVVISGSAYAEFNGAFTVTPTSTTSFTFGPVTVNPPAAAGGSYTATVPSHPIAVTNLTRNGTTVTATSNGHGYVNGQQVAISGSTGAAYDNTYVISNATANTFDFTVAEGPATSATGGTATVGTNNSVTITNITRYTSNSGYGNGNSAIANPGVNQSIVTVTSTSGIPFSAGNTVTIAGSSVSAYNGSWKIVTNGLGTNCPNGSSSGSGKNLKQLSFCFYIATTPASPDTGSSIKADSSTLPLAITSLTRGTNTCPSTTALASATTATAPTFAAGEKVNIGGSAGPNEGAYLGSNVTVVSTSATGFTYNITVTPGCSDSKTGMTASTQGVSRDTLIRWVRGQDSIGDEPSPPDPASPASPITIRGSVHGDVLHSRPAVINYGGTTGVVVFYGSNDGVFRAINGNQPPSTNQQAATGAATYSPKGTCTLTNCSIGGVQPGGELWGFIPAEFYPKLQRLYSNSPNILLATTPTSILPTPVPKDYFFDGPTATYQTFNSDGTTKAAYIFLTARRGGRLIYAFDVTNPVDPKFMWKHTNTDAGFDDLGQTWSQPKVAFVKGYMDSSTTPATAKPVLIFGAGYDGNSYDSTTGTTYLGNDDKSPPGTAAMGRGIFVVDALSGALVWHTSPTASCSSPATCLATAGMTSSIAADITLVDTNFDGFVDRLYAADTGGNIWRVDLEPGTTTPASPQPASWRVTKLASLGGAVTTAAPRKFLFAPDVVVTKNFAAVLAGTGDREHPLQVQTAAYNTVNRFYMILDSNAGPDSSGWTTVVDDSDTSGASAPTQGTLFDATTTPFNISSSSCSGTGGCKGYYLLLNQNPQSTAANASKLGEQVVNAPTTTGGYTYFGTNQPQPVDPNSCSANLGIARAYKVGFLTGSGGFTTLDGGGLPPSPVAGLVQVVDANNVQRTVPFLLGGGGGATSGTIGGGKLETCSGPDCKSSLGAQMPPILIAIKKKRTYWNRQIDQ